MEQLVSQLETTKAQLNKLVAQQNQSLAKDMLTQVQSINGLDVLIRRFENYEAETLKSMIETMLKSRQNLLVFFINVVQDKVLFMAGASQKAIDAGFVASELVKEAAIITGGNGGGRKDFAQAGGKDLSKLETAITQISNKIGVVL